MPFFLTSTQASVRKKEEKKNAGSRYPRSALLLEEARKYMIPVNLKRNHVSFAHAAEDARITLEKAREALVETIGSRGKPA